ncbi:LysR family transcriptional regulator [Chromohalobacter sp. TMW 2.2308]|uniref:LysR family transcriptional regulator n=1 Tax=Chromohalobacter moromii TaxID=2860329 RepID=A0A9X3B4H8_9GAMM|nr:MULTISPECIES: LysR substrate-binding domain-containing protein [Chromohalobacter]MCK2041656.1 LysR family transcriptional regulator [Chromohalobacter moromii]MCK2044593.1 LysR family transcriptional regulator [Chromohalobacter moromii]MCT8504253.1 LysR family transcriptional regulator [Chromohalobacter moromii]MCT8513804.1 LysR family transcriptional regulator [Chromohalobacter sp. TMW 2.2271]
MKIERLPLNALRAFSEAARAGSFKTAAEHLAVTPGAVSRQIKQLEERLGVALFERHAKGVHVTDAGHLLAEDVDAGLARIANGVQAVHERAYAATTLTLSAPPSFTQFWLLPRLAAFEALESHVEISLDADQNLSDPIWHGDGARLALRYGRGPWPGVHSERLLEDALFPVCSPALLERSPIDTPVDLLAHPLLEVVWQSRQNVDFPGWRDWFDAAGLPGKTLPIQQRYSLYGLALDQAIAGRGVMLANPAIVADRLASGVLVRPFGDRHVIDSPFTYDLILPDTGQAPPAIQHFIDWLLDEAARFRDGGIG